MSHLITLENVCLAYGLNPLLENVKFQISMGERVCLIGRNGAGKSSMMKLIDGTLKPDSGNVWRKPGLRLARLEQELPQDIHISVYEYVAKGLAEAGELLAAYHAVTQRMAESCTDADLAEMESLQQQIDAKNAWEFEQNIKTILTRLELDPEQLVSNLSGGWQRRASLAKALVSSPELLLLDEPTNHLDVAAIQWLEDQLVTLGIGLLFITHDRALLQRLATRIIELDRGQLTSWPGDYANFLRRKEEMLHAESRQNAEFDKKLAQEERWIRQGIKARRTRNEGRVRALESLRETRAARREVQGKVSFNANDAAKSGHLVVEAKHISQSFNNQVVIDDFSVRIMRGDRIALIGPNGAGKSTLLNILLGNLTPQQGEIIMGTKLQIAYFDQLRQALDLNKTVIENVTEGSDTIEINNERKHIISYLGDFLFTPQRAMTPVRALSGGECNRLLLAKLFSKPANLLVMDEPTNDLDIETLELLEELLGQYQGTLLLVSHDRTFVDNVVTSTLVFEGQGKIVEYVGGYQDYLKQRKVETTKTTSVKPPVAEKIQESTPTSSKGKKLSYKEQRELTELPALIEKLEKDQADIQQVIADPDFYKNDAEKVAATLEQLKTLETTLEKAYLRWSELE
ncbi:MAG: ATP-binding cassette domain-containing protein [Gammaproteobacteria bacterium]